jgi:hypothetical protein
LALLAEVRVVFENWRVELQSTSPAQLIRLPEARGNWRNSTAGNFSGGFLEQCPPPWSNSHRLEQKRNVEPFPFTPVKSEGAIVPKVHGFKSSGPAN